MSQDRRNKSAAAAPAAAAARSDAFGLEDIANFICAGPPATMSVRDEQLSNALLGDLDTAMLDDMVGYLLLDHKAQDDEERMTGPPKWTYAADDACDSFDFYVATGCPNCGAAYELDRRDAFHLNPPTLLCLQCGHRAARLHAYGETDAQADRLRCGKAASLEGAPAAVYVRGAREQFNFGRQGKAWWQQRFLPSTLRSSERIQTLGRMCTMAQLKAPTIAELCDVCGNGEAFYTTFQARSADEGMTIMYECTRCHGRRIFNN